MYIHSEIAGWVDTKTKDIENTGIEYWGEQTQELRALSGQVADFKNRIATREAQAKKINQDFAHLVNTGAELAQAGLAA